MKKIFKQFIYTVTSAFLMLTPVTAGQCELQTEVPLYQVEDGVTEDEKRVIDYTINYFLENPNAEQLIINNIDFPGITADKYNNLIKKKVDYITEHYPISCSHLNMGYNTGFVYAESITWATYETFSDSYREITIKKDSYGCFDGALEVKNYVDNLYSILPTIGIYNGQDEFEAISILCDFANSYITLSRNEYGCYLDKKGACGDFATTLKALACGAGIDCNVLLSNTESHGWNQVIIDNISYEIDTMWNLTHKNRAYYMLSREQMGKISSHRYVEEVR